jgi:hypothetical protein
MQSSRGPNWAGSDSEHCWPTKSARPISVSTLLQRPWPPIRSTASETSNQVCLGLKGPKGEEDIIFGGEQKSPPEIFIYFIWEGPKGHGWLNRGSWRGSNSAMPMLEGFRFMRGESGIQRTRWRSDNRQRHTKFYPSSRPIGGGSLHPASNLVYDHSCVYREPPKAGGFVLRIM